MRIFDLLKTIVFILQVSALTSLCYARPTNRREMSGMMEEPINPGTEMGPTTGHMGTEMGPTTGHMGTGMEPMARPMGMESTGMSPMEMAVMAVAAPVMAMAGGSPTAMHHEPMPMQGNPMDPHSDLMDSHDNPMSMVDETHMPQSRTNSNRLSHGSMGENPMPSNNIGRNNMEPDPMAHDSIGYREPMNEHPTEMTNPMDPMNLMHAMSVMNPMNPMNPTNPMNFMNMDEGTGMEMPSRTTESSTRGRSTSASNGATPMAHNSDLQSDNIDHYSMDQDSKNRSPTMNSMMNQGLMNQNPMVGQDHMNQDPGDLMKMRGNDMEMPMGMGQASPMPEPSTGAMSSRANENPEIERNRYDAGDDERDQRTSKAPKKKKTKTSLGHSSKHGLGGSHRHLSTHDRYNDDNDDDDNRLNGQMVPRANDGGTGEYTPPRGRYYDESHDSQQRAPATHEDGTWEQRNVNDDDFMHSTAPHGPTQNNRGTNYDGSYDAQRHISSANDENRGGQISRFDDGGTSEGAGDNRDVRQDQRAPSATPNNNAGARDASGGSSQQTHPPAPGPLSSQMAAWGL